MKKNKRKVVKSEFPEGVDRVFQDRKDFHIQEAFRASKKKILKLSNICSVLVIVITYCLLPVSKVQAVNVTGNVLISSKYIKQLSKSENSIFYTNIPLIKEALMKNTNLFEDVNYTLNDNNTITINVKEKKYIGYTYIDDKCYLLCSDGSKIELNSDLMDVIASVPYISGFSEDELSTLCRSFDSVDQSTIQEMAEISQYQLAYDNDNLKILMRSGGYVMSNYHNLYIINSYKDVLNKISDTNKCVFTFSSDTGDTMYTSDCPWNKGNVNEEYWTDSKGNVITNTYGDKIVKHYYTLDDGSDALDSNGNKIPIPIDKDGKEVIDENFQENYKNGLYSSGVLNSQN